MWVGQHRVILDSVPPDKWLEGEAVQNLLAQRVERGHALLHSSHDQGVLGSVTILEPVLNNPTPRGEGRGKEGKGEKAVKPSR